MVSEIDILKIVSGRTARFPFESRIEANCIRTKVRNMNRNGYRRPRTQTYKCSIDRRNKVVIVTAVKTSSELQFKSLPKPVSYRPFRTYIIKDSSSKLVKIGKSVNPYGRLVAIKTAFPDAELLYICERDIESFLHKIYSTSRITGEWYKLSDREINKIVRKYKFKSAKIDFE